MYLQKARTPCVTRPPAMYFRVSPPRGGGACPRCQEQSSAQPTLRVSEPGDASEREADNIAERVMRASLPGGPPVSDTVSAPDDIAAPAPLSAHLNNGAPLDHAARGFFESRFQADFGGVRVHTGPRSARRIATASGTTVTGGA